MSVTPKNVATTPVQEEEVTSVLSEDQLRSKIEGEYATKLAILEQQIASLAQAAVSAPVAARPANNFDFGVNPFEKPADEGDTLVHFLEDGFTVGSVVYYRGQQILLPEKVANYSTREQILAYGRLMYRLGPWDGDEYDVDDPKLNDRERAALIRANESHRKSLR